MENKEKKRPHDIAWHRSHMESKTLHGREIPEKRTQNSKVFDLGRGAFQYVQYPDAVHFKDGDGNWKEIDNRLSIQKNANGKTVLRNHTNALCIELAQQTSEAPLVSLHLDHGQMLAWNLVGASNGVRAQNCESIARSFADEDDRRTDYSFSESSVTYMDVIPDVDIVCRLHGTSFKDDIILKNAHAPHQFVFDLQTRGIQLSCDSDGTVHAFVPGHPEKEVFTLPPAFAQDQNGCIGPVYTRLDCSKDTARMVLSCDMAFLENAAFPVVIDPLVTTFEHSSAMEDNFVTSNAPDTVQSYASGRLRVCKNTSYGECRSFLKFTNLPSFLPSDRVTKAFLRMTLCTKQSTLAVPVYLKDVLADWSSQTITWNNQPPLSETDADVAIVPAQAAVGSTFAFDISNLVRKWYSGSNFGVALERKTNATPNTVEFGSSDSVYYKPVIAINYVNFSGLQNHLAYDSMDCGRAGIGHVNLYNGDLVIERPITHCSGSRMPVSITVFYGQNNFGGCASVGDHWRLSCDQSISRHTIKQEPYFLWWKGDGSRHYFKKPNSGSTYYEDLSGLSLRLTVNDGYVDIEDQQGTVMHFEYPPYEDESFGQLLTVTDACGNQNIFHYTDGNLTSITDGAGRVTTLTYSGTHVSSILPPGETNPVTFSYYDDRLESITDPDGSNTIITWAQATDETWRHFVISIGGSDNRYLEFDHPLSAPYRLRSLRMIGLYYDSIVKGNHHQYTYGDMMTTVHDATVENGKNLIYQFNDFGNVVCVRDELGYASYSKFSEELLPNHPEQVSKLQRSVINLLPNHDFELDGYWNTVSYGGEGTYAYSSDQKHLGSRSMKVNKTNTDGNMCVHMDYTALEIGKTYTLSAYIRSTGSVYTYATVFCGTQWYDGEKITPGNEWTRIFTTFTATTTAATLYFITMGGPGTMWIDSAQFEEGAVPNRYNLLRNCDFSQNSSGVPTFWNANGSNTSNDAIVTSADELHPSFLTNNRMRLYGDPQTNKGFYQELPVSGSQGDAYVVGGWAKGYSRPIGDDPGRFSIRLSFKNGSGVFVASDIVPWNEEWTSWQYASGAVIAPCDYTAIQYHIDYERNVNYADFDALTLYKEEFGNTFVYDEHGNVTTVKDLAGKQAMAEYDEFQNLISYVQPGRPSDVKTTLSYGFTNTDKKQHLPWSVTTPSNVQTSYDYDSAGNVTESTVIDSMDGTCAVITGQSYTSDKNHIATQTNARGKTITYAVDLAKDTITSVTDPTGQSVVYTYDSNRRITATHTSVGGKNYRNTYNYENDRLKTVSHNTTSDTPDVTYSFGYDILGNPTTVHIGSQMLSTNVYTTTGDRTLARVEYGNGGKVHYTRDDFRRVTGIGYDDETVPRFTYSYGANGQIASITDYELGRTSWIEYDTSNRPIHTCMHDGVTNTAAGVSRYYSTIGYDAFGNVAFLKEKVQNAATYETTFAYDIENRPTQLRFGSDHRKVTHSYDPIGRMSSSATSISETPYTTTYSYVPYSAADSIRTTPLLQAITQPNHNFSYEYDDLGNIVREVYNGYHTTYVYDALGQLVRCNNQLLNKSWTFEYDRGGNLVYETQYAYAEGELGAETSHQVYEYNNAAWKDQMTDRKHNGIYGNNITYDAIGNLTTYAGWTYTWKGGRQLVSQVQGNTTITYAYDVSGMRVRKTVNGVTHDYTWNGGRLVHLKAGTNHDLHFFYDAKGTPAVVLYNGSPYAYVKNLQGDIVAIVDASGNTVVQYRYDPWGRKMSRTGTLQATLGYYNPFRYRGYIFDEETWMYYLKNRYYYPELRRFISVDAMLAEVGTLKGRNAYMYCENSPNSYVDHRGAMSVPLLRSLCNAYCAGELSDEELGMTVMSNNANNVYLGFHELAQIHAAKQLRYYGFNAELEVQCSIGEMDIASDYFVWEVKPYYVSGSKQVISYALASGRVQGIGLVFIHDIPVVGHVKMSIASSFFEPGVVRYAVKYDNKPLRNAAAKKLIDLLVATVMLAGAVAGTLRDGNTQDDAAAWAYLQSVIAF